MLKPIRAGTGRCAGKRALRWTNVLAMALALCGALAAAGLRAAERPHIVYILADDLGWKDTGFHGATLRTPNLDKLAEGGAMLNAFYAQPLSSQTRAAALTGRYPMRYGLQTGAIVAATQFGLPAEERTLAQALKEAGYRTAFLGTWQLGHAKPEFWPTKRGFDSFYGSLSGAVPARVSKAGKLDWRRNEKPVQDDGYVSALLAREAASIIDKHDDKAPLFMMVAFNAPANSQNPPKEWLDKYADVADAERRAYAASVSALDAAIGEIVAALDKRKLLERTLIVFHSDNGGGVATRVPTGESDALTKAADNAPFREGRGSLYEGGVRAVALAHWPGQIKPKSMLADPAHVVDWYPTLLKLAGVSVEQKRKLDGMDLWPMLAQNQRSPHADLLLDVEDFRGAIRVGEWKLIVHSTLPMRIELFDVANDPEEVDNRAEAYPDRVKDMLAKLNAYAYDMMPAKYLEDIPAIRPLLLRHNPARP